MLETEAIKKYVKDISEKDILRDVLANLRLVENLLSNAQTADKACYTAGVSAYTIGATKVTLEEYIKEKYGEEAPTIL